MGLGRTPDGGAIAYVRTTQDIMTDNGRPSIWLLDPATGAQSPLVVDDAANMRPRWSPDGSRIAYVVAGPGGAQIYVRWMATGLSARAQGDKKPPNYYPLKAGNKWTYDVDAGNGQKAQTSVRVAKKEKIDDKDLWRVEALNRPVGDCQAR